MHSTYVFHFLNTVSAQLKERLEGLQESPLTDTTLKVLARFQVENESSQGVYVVHYQGLPVYVGKANDVSERLGQHLNKLSGRKGIDLEKVGYKALLLDESMSTAANEDILISMFKTSHTGMWNGTGFGPKDPGQNRDTTEPGLFDRIYPIFDGFPINLPNSLTGQMQIKDLLAGMKNQLPYIFRYSVPKTHLSRTIDVTGTECDARSLLQAVVSFLGEGWKGAILSYGMVLYETDKKYPYGEEILPL